MMVCNWLFGLVEALLKAAAVPSAGEHCWVNGNTTTHLLLLLSLQVGDLVWPHSCTGLDYQHPRVDPPCRAYYHSTDGNLSECP